MGERMLGACGFPCLDRKLFSLRFDVPLVYEAELLMAAFFPFYSTRAFSLPLSTLSHENSIEMMS